MDELDTTDRDGTETDYLATSSLGYGYGYTAEQALAAMARAGRSPGQRTDTVTVDIVEHVGEATTRPGGWQVDTLVSARRVEMDADELQALRDHAFKAESSATRLIEEGDEVERTE